jgi:hypothetical protein
VAGRHLKSKFVLTCTGEQVARRAVLREPPISTTLGILSNCAKRIVIEALQTGQITAAGLDAYKGEPLISPSYRRLPNVFLLPHPDSATIETRTRRGMLAVNNLDAFFAGRTPPNAVACKR